MAEERDDLLPEFDENEEDVLFQVQMKVYNAFMGNWKRLLAISVLFLLGVLIQGLYADYLQNEQRRSHGELLFIRSALPEPDPMSVYGLVPADNPNDLSRMSTLRDSATEMETVATAAKGTAQWFAWIEAADTWERANERDSQIAALQKAVDIKVNDTLKASATLQLANVYMQVDKGEQAIQTLEDFVATNPTVGKSRAQMNLALFYEAAGNKEQARTIAQSMTESEAFIAEAAMLLERLGE